ncbi:MAG: hypothetical protein ABJA57_12135, partial [Ginsengibacter sp.]
MKKVITLLSMIVFVIIQTQAQTLDPTFGASGKVGPFLNGFTPSKYDKAMVVDASGKILIAGSSNGRFAVMRLNSDGSSDNTFGSNGLAEINKPGLAAEAVAIQSDGKIILAGYKQAGQGNDAYDIEAIRLNTDGTTDDTFGSNGVQIITITNDDKAFSVIVQPDDKIVIGGYVNTAPNLFDASTDDFIVLRLTATGPLDGSFNSVGYKVIDFAGDNDMARTLAIDGNGKILIGGKARVDAVTNWDFAIARINTDGSFDNSFSGDGKQTISLTFSNDEIKSIAVQADGNIVLAGLGANGSNNDYEIARLAGSDGSLDAGFDGDGKKLIDFNSAEDDAACVLIKQDGKILVSGNTFNGTNDDFGIVCLNVDGTLDNGFGTGGKYQLDFSNGYDLGNSMRLQADGKLLVGNNVADNAGYHAGIFRLALSPGTDCSITGPNQLCNGAPSIAYNGP